MTGPRPGGGSDRVAAFGLAVVVFVVYAAGACRTIYVGDSGELVTAVGLLGIPHPSGYPLYVLLGKLWTLVLPVGSIAFRMSLFSAACAGAACGLFFCLARRMQLHPAAAATAALTLAFSPSLWAEANVQRVYGLGLLFVVLASAAAWRWAATGQTRTLAFAFFLCGLGATNHVFMATYALALLGFAALADPSLLRRPLRLGAAAAAFLPGLLPYLYLPLRSRARPVLDWGNPESLHNFLNVVLRRGFWDRHWIEGPADLGPIVGDYMHGLARELAWIGAGLALVGIVAWWLREGEGARTGPRSSGTDSDEGTEATGPAAVAVIDRGREGAGLERVMGPPSQLPPARPDRNADVASQGDESAPPSRRRLFILLPLLVMGANLAGLALHGSRADIFIWHRYYIPSYAMAALLAGIGIDLLVRRLPRLWRLVPLLIPLAMLASGWREQDRSRYRIGEDFSNLVLASVAPGAHLAAEDDNILFTLMYLHFVEGKRPDIDLIMEGVGGETIPPLRFDPDRDPLYFTHHPNWALPELQVVPLGAVFRIWRTGRPTPEPVILKTRLDGENDPRVPKDYLTQNLIGHFHYMLGVTLMDRDWPRARREFALAAAASPDNDVLFFNLGLIYRLNGLMDEAASAFRRSGEINPRHIASRQESRASDKLAEIERERERIARVEAGIEAEDPQLLTLPRDAVAWNRRLAVLLEAGGETVAAHGRLLRAIEIEDAAGQRSPTAGP